MTAPVFRPTPHPRPTAPPTAQLATFMAAPRRNAAHRRQPRRAPWRTAVLVAAGALLGLTLLLGLVGWVALLTVVLG